MSRYESMTLDGDRAWVLSSKRGTVNKVDAIVFDCDGVLVDTRRSYDATIVRVTDTMLDRTLGLRLPWRRIGPPLIRMLRRTGGFNNDWNTTYALIIFSALCAPPGDAERLMTRRDGLDRLVARLCNITKTFCSSSPGVGYRAVDEFVTGKASDAEAAVIKTVRDQLGYPGSPPESKMATLFDELYHGPELFKQMYGFGARYHAGKGMIERDKVIIRERVLKRLAKVLGRSMALATGRPFLATKYSLGGLIDYFDPGASVFMGEADVHPQIAHDYEKYQKPSGYSLIRAMQSFACDTLLYVGDSEEDRMMVENAKSSGEEAFLFAGIYGTAVDEEEQVNYLKSKKADLILRSVNEIPRVLEMARD